MAEGMGQSGGVVNRLLRNRIALVIRRTRRSAPRARNVTRVMTSEYARRQNQRGAFRP